jgi:hypothetical protein
MQATANSKIVSSIGIIIKKILVNNVILIMALPNKDISKCPAIKFAVSRTDRVIGRIRFLTNSINTINIINELGVPWGTKCDSIMFVFFTQPNMINLIQNVNEIGKLKVI